MKKSPTKSAGVGHRSLEARLLPYVPPWLIGIVAIPAASAALHRTAGGDPIKTPLITLAIACGTGILTALAWHLGSKREPIVRAHTAITVALAGIAVTITTVIGLPRPWLWTIALASTVIALSWNLRRIDALRHDGASQAEQDTWAKQLGLENVRPGKAKQVGARLEIPLVHGVGSTVKDIQKALPALEAAAGVPSGRSRVIEDTDNAGRSTLVIVKEDVLKDTIDWVGPSHPGGSIADPIHVGMYEDDQVAKLWVPGAPGRAPAQILYMGMSRAGKTLTALINTAELLTRTDVVVWWGDLTKGAQTAGPIQQGLDWYADTPAAAKAMFRAAKDVVRARADALGKAGFRQWSPEAFTHPDLHMPYLVIHLEEASEILEKNTADFVWLTEKSLSTGVSVSVSMQRASHASMPTDGRYNINTVMCFGTGDNYSASFALSESTIDAGAHPEKWKARRQGYFYLECNGVDEERFPVPARSYFATDAEIADTIATWAPFRAHLDRISTEAAGPSYKPSTPRQEINMDTEPTDADELAAIIAESMAELPCQPEPELAANTNPSEPIPQFTGENITHPQLPDAPSDHIAETAFDTAIHDLHQDGKTVFSVADLAARYPYRSRSTVSRRLTALAEGETTTAHGLALERLDRDGMYRIHAA